MKINIHPFSYKKLNTALFFFLSFFFQIVPMILLFLFCTFFVFSLSLPLKLLTLFWNCHLFDFVCIICFHFTQILFKSISSSFLCLFWRYLNINYLYIFIFIYFLLLLLSIVPFSRNHHAIVINNNFLMSLLYFFFFFAFMCFQLRWTIQKKNDFSTKRNR